MRGQIQGLRALVGEAWSYVLDFDVADAVPGVADEFWTTWGRFVDGGST